MTINSVAKTNTDTTAKIVRDLEKLTTWTIIETNKYLETFEIYGKTLQDYKDTMNTADFTKFFQYIVNDVIEAGIKKLGLNGVREEVSGWKDSFSTLELLNDEEGCILSQYGKIKKAVKKLHFLPLPTDILVAYYK